MYLLYVSPHIKSRRGQDRLECSIAPKAMQKSFFYCKIARKRARGPTDAPGFIVRGRESEASEEEAGGAKAVWKRGPRFRSKGTSFMDVLPRNDLPRWKGEKSPESWPKGWLLAIGGGKCARGGRQEERKGTRWEEGGWYTARGRFGACNTGRHTTIRHVYYWPISCAYRRNAQSHSLILSLSLSLLPKHIPRFRIRLALCTSSKFTKGLPLNRCRCWDARLGGGVIKYIKELPAAMDSLTNFIGRRAVDR